MIAKADKGKTTVIIYAQDYNDKVHEFLPAKTFVSSPRTPQTTITKPFSKHYNNVIVSSTGNKSSSLARRKHPHPQTMPS